MEDLKRFIIPIVITLVATINLYNVHTTELSRWRGGGFGMYTEPHWTDNEVWFIDIPRDIDVLAVYAELCDKVRRNPSDKNLLELGKAVQRQHGYQDFSLEVWKIDYDIKTFTATKLKVNEIHIK